MGLFNKKEIARINELEEENKKLRETINSFGGMNRFELEQESKKIQESIKLKKSELDSINAKIVEAQSKLFDLNDDIDLQDFALYTPKYDCMDSNEYSEKIKACRQEQKYMIRNKMALAYSDNWTLDGSKAKGRAMNNDNMKMVLRAFNNECDSIIDKVKFNNIERISNKNKKALTGGEQTSINKPS